MMQAMDNDGHRASGDIPKSAPVYLNPSYWDERFTKEEHYEWFKNYSQFRHLLTSVISPSHEVLELGCGSSQMCDGLFGDGIRDLTCIDISSVAVDKMQLRLKEKGFHEVKVQVADMLNLPFEKQSFDIVIDKGTMDVLLVDGGDPWNPKPEAANRVLAMPTCVHDVLTAEGIFISVSFGKPHFRRSFFERAGFSWSMEWKTFGDGFHYFYYIFKKGTRNPTEKEEATKENFNNNNMTLYQEHLKSGNNLTHIEIAED